ncbi:hypothetical protein F0U62_29450 [Cystobacter fuscus]|uniref:HNH endonuclease n=1 Tax=Cystobacter fuscus TaxID=43 RepID=UPI002B2C4457|nr:hypothetical protein F0U62_29450 [Cystobacter fuscus]
MAGTKALTDFLHDILCGDQHFLGGVQKTSRSLPDLLTAIVGWGNSLGRGLDEIAAVIEPCLRQSVLISLLPAKALDPNYQGSIDASIDEHLAQLKINLSQEERRVVRDVCINLRKLQGLSSQEARNRTYGISQLKAERLEYERIVNRQNGRCIWCGVHFQNSNVEPTLEHMAPKHLGDDLPDGSNWALSCSTCNAGKGSVLSWAATPAAHDYINRTDPFGSNKITQVHRWSVLMRTRRCSICSTPPSETELWVYRRVKTGLAIPSNCSTSCGKCALAEQLEVLVPIWSPKEGARQLPI